MSIRLYDVIKKDVFEANRDRKVLKVYPIRVTFIRWKIKSIRTHKVLINTKEVIKNSRTSTLSCRALFQNIRKSNSIERGGYCYDFNFRTFRFFFVIYYVFFLHIPPKRSTVIKQDFFRLLWFAGFSVKYYFYYLEE